MTGTLVLVVGPSGAGKDSILDGARAALATEPRVRFLRRAITRPAEAGGEAHEAVSEAAFHARRAAGGFALSWCAHGLLYGIPADALAGRARGMVCIANISRTVVAEAAERLPPVLVAHITAPPPVLATRLAARGRESRAEIEARLARAAPFAAPPGVAVAEIVNDASLAEAVARFCALLRGCLGGGTNVAR
ncbi:MAG: phosphonate metabolism protein/1,5-bisphosphokinase (PRPP-forming) PhnN [Alphaproteobacteria bacterium]|nr:phosphonate metabolism protein/1,5-bisphosphokinase (PRPP-forming) PhnN [Alphaproteobacteria bacterium]